MSVLCVSGVTVSRVSKNCRMLSLPNRVGCILYGSLVTTLKPQIQFARWNRSNKLCKSSGVIEEQGEKKKKLASIFRHSFFAMSSYVHLERRPVMVGRQRFVNQPEKHGSN